MIALFTRIYKVFKALEAPIILQEEDDVVTFDLDSPTDKDLLWHELLTEVYGFDELEPPSKNRPIPRRMTVRHWVDVFDYSKRNDE